MDDGAWRAAGKPWLERREGECAYPVAGASWTLRSCGAPATRGQYCAPHARRMRWRPRLSLRAWLERWDAYLGPDL